MPFFDIFASPRWSPLRMRTKVASFFIFFQELSNKKKIKALRPKMTKIASRGGGGPALIWFILLMGRTIGLGRIWSFVLGFRSLVSRLAAFKRESEQRGRIFWQRKVWTANFSATMVRQEVWREKRKVRFFGKGQCELTAIVRISGLGKV